MMKNHTRINPTKLHATIKLGIETHGKWFFVAAGISLFHALSSQPAGGPGVGGRRAPARQENGGVGKGFPVALIDSQP